MKPSFQPSQSRTSASRGRAASGFSLGCALVALMLARCSPPVQAADFSAWPQRQEIVVPSAGLIKVPVPIETLGASQPGLRDLRLLSPTGQEMPYAILRPKPRPPSSQAPGRFQTAIENKTTVITLETGTDAPLEGVTLLTPAFEFIKAVDVHSSPDGVRWQELTRGQPVFSQGGVRHLRINLPRGIYPHLRLRINDARTEPVGFTGATLAVAGGESVPVEPVPASIVERENGSEETRLVVNLGAANLDVAFLEFETSTPLFMRRVRVAVRRMFEDSVREDVIRESTIYRVAVDGLAPASGLKVSLDRQALSRELVLLIQNEDNPPLEIQAVRVWRHPVHIAWVAREPGVHALLYGHLRAAPARYDLGGFVTNLETAPSANLRWSAPQPNPAYRRPEALPEVAELGATIDLTDWRRRKPVRLDAPGVQQLELDLEVLARAQHGWADLRLVRDKRQVPYVIDHPSLTREIKVTPTLEKNPKKPSESRWILRLPTSRLPLQRLVCESPTPLFQREVRLYEMAPDSRGEPYERTLAIASWTQTPERKSRTFSLNIQTAPMTDTLVLSTDNGDNPALELANFRFTHPVTRLLFKSSTNAPLELYFDNPKASAPRYDLGLVAPQLLAADRTPARLGEMVVLKGSLWSERAAGKGGVVFWGVLALVVAGLLLLIKRLIPHHPEQA